MQEAIYYVASKLHTPDEIRTAAASLLPTPEMVVSKSFFSIRSEPTWTPYAAGRDWGKPPLLGGPAALAGIRMERDVASPGRRKGETSHTSESTHDQQGGKSRPQPVLKLRLSILKTGLTPF